MKKFLSILMITTLALGLSITDADAKRLGGGGSSGIQRSTPAMRQAPREAPKNDSTSPTAANPASPAAGVPSGAAPAKQGFMSKWGGLIAGVGMGALLGSMFGGAFGGGMGSILSMLLLGLAVFMIVRFIMARFRPAPPQGAYAGAGMRSVPNEPTFRDTSSSLAYAPLAAGTNQANQANQGSSASSVPPGFDTDTFIRAAKLSFIRLQAANDAGDLADIRGTTTPEMYAEIAMQLRERAGAPQQTDVVTLNANLIEAVVEGDDMVVSVRYSGTIREVAGTLPEPFDEVWHLRRAASAPNAPWLIAGIQQMRDVAH